MWAVEGLTHRYPTKVLVELVMTCPQYCGYCTRMDLVGPSTPQATKRRFGAATPSARRRCSTTCARAAGPRRRRVGRRRRERADRVARAVRLGPARHRDDPRGPAREQDARRVPQHYLQPELLAAVERLATTARARGANIALHTHANHRVPDHAARRAGDARAARRRPAATCATRASCCAASTTPPRTSLGLSERLLYDASIMPYYVFMGDIVPERRALAHVAAPGAGAAAGDHGAACRDTRRRGCLRRPAARQEVGAPGRRTMTASAGSARGPSATATAIEVRRTRARRRSRTTTRSTRCPRRGSAGGPRRPPGSPRRLRERRAAGRDRV